MSSQTLISKRYLAGRRIGEGGVARVFEALDQVSGEQVAIKLLLSKYIHNEEIRRRFKREARLMAGLDHPHIVRCLDRGEDESGQPFLVMELIHGGSLSALADDLNCLRDIGTISAQVLSALSLIHAQGIIHRDLKPQNILMEGGPTNPHAKLLDFGFARFVSAAESETTADAFGTPLYMSPEQVENQSQVGPASDLYSMGVILYELLTGQPPFSGPHGMAVALMHLTEPVPDLRPKSGITIPAALSEVVRKSLSKDPADRFESAEAMRRALVDSIPGLDDVALPAASGQVSLPAEGTVESGDSHPTIAFTRVQESPFIGRANERAWLWGHLRDIAAGGEARFIFIEAMHGMGRRRLQSWLRAETREDGRVKVLTLGRLHSRDEVLGGINEVLEQIFLHPGNEETGLSSAISRQVDEWSRTPGSESVNWSLQDQESLARYVQGRATNSGDHSPSDAFEGAVCKLLALAAAERPLLLSIQGMENTGPRILSFLQKLSASLSLQPCSMMVTVGYLDDPQDPGYRDAVHEAMAKFKVSAHRLRLDPFEKADFREFLRRIAPLERAVEESISQRTKGNPLFATELVHLLWLTGELTEVDGKLRLTQRGDPSSWPSSLEEVVKQRAFETLKRMKGDSQADEVLAAASILGESFDYQVLRHFLQQVFGDRLDAERQIEVLIEACLLREPARGHGDRLHFVHPMVLESMSGALTKQRARDLNAAAVVVYRNLYGVDATEHSSLLAKHLEGAGASDEAAVHYLRAGRGARRRVDFHTARALFERGLQCVVQHDGSDERLVAELWLELASMDVLGGHFVRAQKLAARVYQWADQRDFLIAADALSILGKCLLEVRQLYDAERAISMAQERFRQIGQEKRWAVASVSYLICLRELKEWTRIDEWLSNNELPARHLDDFARAQVTLIKGHGLLARQAFELAVPVLEYAREQANSAGAVALWGESKLLLAETFRQLERPQEEVDCLLTVAQASMDEMPVFLKYRASIRLGESASRLDDQETALRWLERSLLLAEQLGDDDRAVGGLALKCGILALSLGRFDEGQQHLDRAVSESHMADELQILVARTFRAACLARRGALEAALTYFDSVDLRAVGAFLDDDLADGLVLFGQTLCDKGQQHRGKLLLAMAHRLYVSLGMDGKAARLHLD